MNILERQSIFFHFLSFSFLFFPFLLFFSGAQNPSFFCLDCLTMSYESSLVKKTCFWAVSRSTPLGPLFSLLSIFSFFRFLFQFLSFVFPFFMCFSFLSFFIYFIFLLFFFKKCFFLFHCVSLFSFLGCPKSVAALRDSLGESAHSELA